MFTGLVVGLVEVVDVAEVPPGRRLTIRAPALSERATLGASICLSGCCLSVVAIEGDRLTFELGPETLRRTTLGQLAPGGRVNVEPSLRVGDELGGHFVTGHVDAVGTLDERSDDGRWSTLWFRVPTALLAQMASKGSVAIDGVSLTLVDVEAQRFSVALIPHTLSVTTLGALRVGGQVNVETDLLAKYIERRWLESLEHRGPPQAS